MGSKKPVHAPLIDPGPYKQTKPDNCHSHAERLVWSQAGFQAVGPESLRSHKLGSAVSIVSVMILSSLAHIIPFPSLQLNSQSSTWCLVVGLCIWFNHLLNDSPTPHLTEGWSPKYIKKSRNYIKVQNNPILKMGTELSSDLSTVESAEAKWQLWNFSISLIIKKM